MDQPQSVNLQCLWAFLFYGWHHVGVSRMSADIFSLWIFTTSRSRTGVAEDKRMQRLNIYLHKIPWMPNMIVGSIALMCGSSDFDSAGFAY